MSAESSPLSSALSPPPSSDDEMAPFLLSRKSSPAQSPVDMSSPPATSSPSKGKKREPSPPHEDVLADNPDIAVRRWRVYHVYVHAISTLDIINRSSHVCAPSLISTAVSGHVPRTLQ